MKRKSLILLAGLTLLLFAKFSHAETFFVRPLGPGDASTGGTNWTNAWASPGNINWSRITPGSKICLAGGTYSGFESIGASGTDEQHRVTIKRATKDDPHCGRGTLGWPTDDHFDSQVVINVTGIAGIYNGYDKPIHYVTIDGVVENGIRFDVTSAHRTIVDSNNQYSQAFGIAAVGNHNEFKYLEIVKTTGLHYGLIGISAGNDYNYGRTDYLLISHVNVRGLNAGFFFSAVDHITLEYSTVSDQRGDGANHANLAYVVGSYHGIVRYNRFWDWLDQGIGLWGPGINDDWKIYGNIWHDNFPGSLSPCIVIGPYTSHNFSSDWYIYNNTFVNVGQSIRGNGGQGGTVAGGQVKNNVFYNAPPAFDTLSHDSNWYGGFYLQKIPTTATIMPPLAIGDRVQASISLEVRSIVNTSRGEPDTVIGKQPFASQGAIDGGPISGSGHRWWRVNFDTGVDGWVLEHDNILDQYEGNYGEANGVAGGNSDPFTDLVGGNFSLRAGATGIDRGTNLTTLLGFTPEMQTDAAGTTRGAGGSMWDIGAYEFGGPVVPINGACGSLVNSCSAGILQDIPDSATQNLWNCNGTNGGSNASCSLPIAAPANVSDGTPLLLTVGIPLRFDLTDPGSYKLVGKVTTQSAGTNSFYVDIDINPGTNNGSGDETKAWDILYPPALTNSKKDVSWRGIHSATCYDTPQCAQYNPKVWTLTSGIHTLFVNTREPGTQIQEITFVKTTPVTGATLTVTRAGNGSVVGTRNGSTIITCDSSHSDCFEAFASTPTTVILTADHDLGATFTGWSLPSCPGTDPCTVTVTEDINITATFNGGMDSTLPTVSLNYPENGSVLSGSTVLLAVASDNGGVREVQFFVDNQPLDTPKTSSPYFLSWDTTRVSNGSHVLTAKATDTSNNSVTSRPVAVTVSNSGTTIIQQSGFGLFKNKFNPARGESINIPFTLNQAGQVTLTVYDRQGREIKVLLDEFKNSGSTITIPWNGKNDQGEVVASGVYTLLLKTPEGKQIKKVAVIK